MIKLYKDIREISGPLLEIGNIEGVFYEELVEVEMQDGTRRQGQVIQIRDDVALIAVYEGTDGIMPTNSGVRFMGKPFTLDVSPDIVGRVFDGLGRPKDGGAPVIAEKSIDVNGLVINPIARDYPNEFIQTGISAIDHLNTLVRGQKLPIFSAAGLPHQQLSAQIARQAKVLNSDDRFAVVFAAMGITFEGADFYINEFKDSGALEHSVLFMNLANDPVMERIATPKMALTAAEYLAFERDMHVLVIMNDMSKYCEALREISSARREVPGRRGYPGYLYTNLASLYERAGRIKGRKGSVTQIPIVTMPEGDITHPIPDLTGYITEGQILLSKELLSKGINPPIDVLTSLSRLKDNGIGAGKTREDHANTMNQVFAAYAKGKAAKELSIVLGESSLTNLDRIYAQLADVFEQKYLNQGFQEDRTIDQTLDIAWEVLSLLPEGELKRIKKEYIEKYWRKEQAEQ